MQFKKRFTLISICGTLTIAICLLYFHAFSKHNQPTTVRRPRTVALGQRSFGNGGKTNPRSFLNDDVDSVFAEDQHPDPHQRSQGETALDWRKCRMETCFDFHRCKNGFKIYLYPRQTQVSAPFNKILAVLEKSRYLTANPQEACVFIPTIDTLDQDVLSKDYVPSVDKKLQSLPYWNGGRNHLLFNQYSGTWPLYSEVLSFIQQAMLVKSSMSITAIRYGFDVSLPLFPKDHPQSGGIMGYLHNVSNSIPSVRQYLLAFKGKRYLNGIGSDARNTLYHIHNGKDIVVLTTCKHGKGWEKLMDDRCLQDNEEYDK